MAAKGAIRLDQHGATRRLSPADREALNTNAGLRGIHRGQRCFVIGNGPSLGTQDISKLGPELTFTMSGFWKHSAVQIWKPTYYFLMDPLFFDGSSQMAEFFSGVRSAIHPSHFFMPLSAQKAILDNQLLPGCTVSYVALHGGLDQVHPDSLDFTGVVPGGMSVAQFAIMAAIYMGCAPIYLLGLDHDWLAHRGQDSHFYSGTTVQNHPTAHGDLSKLRYVDDLTSVLSLWRGYETLHDIAGRAGLQILNATRGGFLDVFPRVDFDSLVSSSKTQQRLEPPLPLRP